MKTGTGRQVDGTMTLKSLNRAMLAQLRSLDKWSGLLYLQTASRPADAEPRPPTHVHRLPASSARESANQAALVVAAIARRLRTVGARIESTVRRKLVAQKPPAKPPRPAAEAGGRHLPPPGRELQVAGGGETTLESLNRVMTSALIGLEKWSRLLYRQTALSAAEMEPEPVDVDELPVTSARQSAEQASSVLAAIVRRLNVVEQRVERTVQKKIESNKPPATVQHAVVEKAPTKVQPVGEELEPPGELAVAEKEPITVKPIAETSAPTKMPPIAEEKETGPSRRPPASRVGTTVTLKSLNEVLLSALVGLEKWSRLLYRQTEDAEPEPIVVGQLPATSAHESAQSAALVLAAIAERLRTVGQRVRETVHEKFVAETAPTEAEAIAEAEEQETQRVEEQLVGTAARPGAEETKPEKAKIAATSKSRLPATAAGTSKQKVKTSKTKPKEKAAAPQTETDKAKLETSSKSPLSAKEMGKQKGMKGKKDETRSKQKAAGLKTKPDKQQLATSAAIPAEQTGEQKGRKGRKKPKQTGAEPEIELEKEKVVTSTKSPLSEEQKGKKKGRKGKKKTDKKKSKQKSAAQKTESSTQKLATSAGSAESAERKGKQRGKKGRKTSKQEGATPKTKLVKQKLENSADSPVSAERKIEKESTNDKTRPKQKGAVVKTKSDEQKLVTSSASRAPTQQKSDKESMNGKKKSTQKGDVLEKLSSTRSPLIGGEQGKGKGKKGREKAPQNAAQSKTKPSIGASSAQAESAPAADSAPAESAPAAPPPQEPEVEPPEPEVPRHVITRDDMIGGLWSRLGAVAGTVRDIAAKVDDAMESGDEGDDQYGQLAESGSEAEAAWIRYMNERLRSAGAPTQQKLASTFNSAA